jgi:hypothetical protein
MVSPKKAEPKVRSRSEFSYKTDAQTPLAQVFAYLNGKLSSAFTLREGKQRAIDALLAFWKPYALKASQAQPEVVRDAAIASVTALSRHLQRICADFNVDSPCAPIEPVDFSDLLAALKSRAEPAGVVSERQLEAEVRSQPTPISDRTTTPEMIFINDEELLGDLL